MKKNFEWILLGLEVLYLLLLIYWGTMGLAYALFGIYILIFCIMLSFRRLAKIYTEELFGEL